MEGIKDAMNAAVTGQGTTSKRIAGDADREYVLQKDAPVQMDRKSSSGGLPSRKVETGGSGGPGSGGLGSGGSGPLGKPPLAPRRDSSQVRLRYRLRMSNAPASGTRFFGILVCQLVTIRKPSSCKPPLLDSLSY